MRKKIIVLIFSFLLLVFTVSIKAETAPADMKQEILKQWDFLVSFMEMEYSADFSEVEKIKDCEISDGIRYLTVDVSLLLEKEVNTLKQLEKVSTTKEYLFYTSYDLKGIMLIEMYDDNGVYSFGRIGGKASAFNDALVLMSKLTKENCFNLYRVSMNDYLLSYDDGTKEYIIPFSQTEKLLPEYYAVEKLNQLPTVEDYLKLQKEKLIEIKAEIEEYQKIHPDELMYGIDYYVELLPKKSNVFLKYGLIIVPVVIILSGYMFYKGKKTTDDK